MQNNFTVSENEIAQFVINNMDDVVTSTITAVAHNTNTSEASINRFCKKLGFKGFNSLKIALAQENFYGAMNQGGEHDGLSLISSVRQDYNKMIMNTAAMLDENDLIQAAACIKSAPRVYIFADGATLCVALDMEFRLTTAGISAKAVTDLDYCRVAASNIQIREVLLVLVPTITHALYQTLAMAKDRGAFIMAAISYESPKQNDILDFKFITSDKIIAQNSVSLSNNLMFLFVMDVLFSTLLKSDKALKQKKLNSEAAILGASQSADNYMLNY
jgi:DNA-binding MurR/RpiR family transcriptional regulator